MEHGRSHAAYLCCETCLAVAKADPKTAADIIRSHASAPQILRPRSGSRCLSGAFSAARRELSVVTGVKNTLEQC